MSIKTFTMSKNLKWIILILLAITWGSSFILMKKGLEGGLRPIQIGALRVISAALFLVTVGFHSLKNIPKSKWKFIAMAGLFGNFLPIFLFIFAQTEISSSISSSINALTPLNTMIIGTIMLGVIFTNKQKIGILLGLVGCLLLVYSGAQNNPSKNYWFALLIGLATCSYGLNINLVKKYLYNVSPISVVVGSFAIYLIPAIIIFLLSDFDSQFLVKENWKPILSIVVLGIVGTGIANIYFYKLIHISTPLFASSVTYLIPVVATFFGFFDNEKVSWNQLIGSIVVLFGVYISNRNKVDLTNSLD